MANILVNGMKSKAGGGKVIFDTYLRLLVDSAPDDHYWVLTPDRDAYLALQGDGVSIIDVPRWAHSNLATIPLYHHVFKRLLSKLRIDAILNFGDIVIPTDVPQVYNFDWAFAVYPEHLRSQALGRAEGLAYRMKLYFFEAYLRRATIIMAQTEAMKARLEARYSLTNVVLVPAAVAPAEAGASRAGEAQIALPPGRRYLVYPANFYPHKNIEILLPVAARLKALGSDIGIVTTLAADEHEGAAAFLQRVKREGLGDVLVNVGPLPAARVPALFDAGAGLLMPTLLETFGLPYVEAMQHQRPILTSDRDFARAVCGDAAAYFDPLDPASIVATIDAVLGDPDQGRRLVARGQDRLATMWNWPRVFAEYQSLLGQVWQAGR